MPELNCPADSEATDPMPSTARGESGRQSCRHAEISDEQLIAALQATDRSSAAAVYDHLLPVVDRTLRRILGRREQEHDDLVQQSFEQIIKTLIEHRFARSCNLKSWASTLTARVALTELRRRYRQRRVIVDEPMDLEQIAAADWRKQAAVQADFDQLRRALGSLKPERALVLYLHDVEGHRLADIGVMVGSSVSAVQSLLVRGRTQLHERYRLLDPSGLQPASSELQDAAPCEPEDREWTEPKAGHVP